MAASPWALILHRRGARAKTFSITNRCSFPVWLAAIPAGGGRRLNSGYTWNLEVDGPRIWGRTGCNFNGNRGSCATGDCAGALYCGLSGSPPATLAEFSLGSQDYYDISVTDDYNVPVDLSCSTRVALRCRDAGCYDAYHQPNNIRTRSCGGGNRSFRIVFCP